MKNEKKTNDEGTLFGDFIFDASSILDKKRKIIKTSPNLDLILNGGILDGTITLVSGPPKVGKTLTCLHIAKNAQQLGKKVYFISVEGRLQKRDLEGIEGLDLSPDKFKIVASSKKKILSAHEFIEKTEGLLKTQENIFVIFDSFSQLCPEALREHDMSGMYRDYTPALLSWFTKRISGILSLRDNCLVGILHRMSNQDPQSKKKWIEAGGNKIQYAYDNKLVAKFQIPWITNDEQVGQIVSWVCESNAIGKPNKTCDSYIRYGIGIDVIAETFNIAKEIGIIKKAGSWFYFQDEKYHGMDSMITELKNNPELYKTVENEIAELIV